MPDREKVIKGLQNLREAIAFDYIHETDQAVETLDNALKLLKEQIDEIKELRSIVEFWKEKALHT